MAIKDMFDNLINGSSYATYRFLGDTKLSATFHHFFYTLPGNFYCKDKKGRYFLVSDYLLSSHGFTDPTDVIGKTDFDLFLLEEANQLKSNDLSVIESGKPTIFEEKITLKDGKKRYYEVIKTPLRNTSNVVIGIIGNSVEVTKRHQIENDLKESKQLTSKFVQNMKHDIHTPLFGLEKTISVLLSKEQDPFRKQVLEFSANAVKELKSLLNTFLNFDREQYHNPL